MAKVVVSVAAARDRALPSVSVKSGAPADGYVPVTVANRRIHLPLTQSEFERVGAVGVAARDDGVGRPNRSTDVAANMLLAERGDTSVPTELRNATSPSNVPTTSYAPGPGVTFMSGTSP